MKNKFKTILYILVIFYLICGNNIMVYGKEIGKEKVNITSNSQYDKIKVNAKAAIAIDMKTKRVLYEKNAYNIVSIASTTKIITALVALKYGNLEDKYLISQNAVSIKGSKAGYKKGDYVSLKELLFGLMLRSGNDAAIAIAEGISGNVEDFSKLMNDYSHMIGLINTNFETPHGLDRPKHYSTAYDLAIATSKAKEIDLFNKITMTKDLDKKEYDFSRDYHNINKILWQIPEADGVKTGYTGQAGKCLVTSINNGSSNIIIVVLNSPERWKETKKIYDYVLENYEFKKITKIQSMDLDIVIPIKKGEEFSVKLNGDFKKGKLIKQKSNNYNFSVKVYEGNTLVYTYKIVKVAKNKKVKKWLFF